MHPFELIRPGVAAPPTEAVVLAAPASRRATFGEYLLDPPLAFAVNTALHLGRPLLITGEPGTGKTALAWGVARRLGAGDVLEFHARSTSVARDLLYSVDSIRRFADASVNDENARNAAAYLRFEALGEAIRSPATRVVLVDEIDKAPRDFPNDLLNELDRMEFTVPELAGTRFAATARHLVVITSNSERRLPPAFLRRCVYHHIPFPDQDSLRRIVGLHTSDIALSPGFLELALIRFLKIRALPDLLKVPATDELIAWTRVLIAAGTTEAALAACTRPGDLPALGVLLKHGDDLARVRAED